MSELNKYRFISSETDSINALKESASLNRLVAPHKPLGVVSLNDVVVIPCRGILYKNKLIKETTWNSVDDTSCVYDEDDFLDCQSECGEAYYIGTFHSCWGHEITDGMRLLWGLIPALGGINLPSNVKFVYSVCDLNHHFGANFKQLLSFFGINDTNMLLVSKPTRFKTLYIPDESCFYDINTPEKRTFTTTYQHTFEYLCRQIVPNIPKRTRIVYLSRSAWKKGNPDFGEKYIEEAFKKKFNCEVYYPEQLTFIEMVKLLQETKMLITTEGSISHNALFLQPGSDLVILRKAGFISYYQLMVNQIKDLNVTYIDAHRTHHFYCSETPYFGPFFLLVNKSLAEYLQIKPNFPVVPYLRYRTHVAVNDFKRIVAQLAHKILPFWE